MAQEATPETQAPLTLEAVESLALGHHPALARAQALVEAAQGNWVQVGLPYNPLVGYLGQQLGSGGQAEQHGLLIQQEFIRGGKRQLNRAVAEKELLLAEQQFAAQEQRVLTDVRLAFYEGLLSQRRVELARELTSVAAQGVATVDQLRKAGESTRIDLLQADLELRTAEILLRNAENHQVSTQRSLAAAIGVPELPAGQLAGDLEEPPTEISWDQSLDQVLTLSPEIAAAAASLERARWAWQRANAEPTPNITVQGVVMSDNAIQGKTDGILQLTLPLPLYNRNQGGIQQARAEIVAAEQALVQTELRLRQRLAPVYARYASAHDQHRVYRERILPAAAESLELVRQGHRAGEYPFLNLLTAQRTYFQTNLQYLDVLRDLRLSTIEIEGLLLRDSQDH